MKITIYHQINLPFYSVQVVGRKTVWLAPPHATPFMYPFSSSNNSGDLNMSNTSRVDVFSKVDENEFPDFQNEVVPSAIHAILEPGDLLFLPVGWWHSMRSEETSFSVSMWF